MERRISEEIIREYGYNQIGESRDYCLVTEDNALSLWMLFECGGSPTKRYDYMDAMDEYEYHYYSPREYRQLAMGKE